jgi:RNA polymerase sigma-70 factor, ECF subfamily
MGAALAIAPAEDDRVLVERFRSGEARAFDELVRRYQGSIQRLARRFLRDPEDARDLAQRAFVQAFERLETFRGEASFRTWVYRIAVNLSLSQVRRRKVNLEELGDPAAPAESGPDGDTVRRLRQAVKGLPTKQRLCVELRAFDDLSFKEVGEVVGCSEAAAKMNFHHALKKLRDELKEDEQ